MATKKTAKTVYRLTWDGYVHLGTFRTLARARQALESAKKRCQTTPAKRGKASCNKFSIRKGKSRWGAR